MSDPTLRAPVVSLPWVVAASSMAAACVAYAAMPARWIVAADVVLYPLVGLVAAAMIVVGLRRYGPHGPAAWALIAAGVAMFALGDEIWALYAVADREPFPSIADAAYLAGYPLVAVGLVIATRWRSPRVSGTTLVDAAIVSLAAGVCVWVYLIEPYRADPELGALETVISIAYPIGDLLLLAVAARFLLGASLNVAAVRLLTSGIVLWLVGDVLFTLDVLGQLTIPSRIIDSLLLVGVAALGLAGLHPSMRLLTEEAMETSQGGRVRSVVVGVAAALPLVVLGARAAADEPLVLPVTVGGVVAMAMLLVLRFAGISARAKLAAEHDAILASYSAELLRLHERSELLGAARRAVEALAGPGVADIVEGPPAPLGTHAFSSPIVLGDEVVGEVVVPDRTHRLSQLRDRLTMLVSQLSLALERHRLLESEQQSRQTLAEQNEALRELDAMKDQFVGTVSHELRTPLTSMLGYLETLLDGDVGELAPAQRNFVEIVERNCHRLNHLVDDVLVLARADAGRMVMVMSPVEVEVLVRSAVESASAGARRRNVDLSMSSTIGADTVMADAAQLGQLLDNLISNAVKFTPAGGDVRVVLATTDDGAVSIAVADSGVGIPADEIGQLFQRFNRASTSEGIPGTGLGLAIAKTIAEAHGGTITVQSQVGAGTTFVVELALSTPAATYPT